MPDRFGPRGVIALFIPLQNANMQPEYDAMRPEGSRATPLLIAIASKA